MKEWRNGNSADVHIHLVLNHRSLPVARLGPDFLILHEPSEHPVSDAEMCLIVDDQEDRWAIRLPQGIEPGHKVVPISTI